MDDFAPKILSEGIYDETRQGRHWLQLGEQARWPALLWPLWFWS